MGLGPIFNLSAWDSVARQAMIRWGAQHHSAPLLAPLHPCKMLRGC